MGLLHHEWIKVFDGGSAAMKKERLCSHWVPFPRAGTETAVRMHEKMITCHWLLSVPFFAQLLVSMFTDKAVAVHDTSNETF